MPVLLWHALSLLTIWLVWTWALATPDPAVQGSLETKQQPTSFSLASQIQHHK
jgi:hypothetical protein